MTKRRTGKRRVQTMSNMLLEGGDCRLTQQAEKTDNLSLIRFRRNTAAGKKKGKTRGRLNGCSNLGRETIFMDDCFKENHRKKKRGLQAGKEKGRILDQYSPSTSETILSETTPQMGGGKAA